MSAPIPAAGQFQFTLSGDASATYIIEASTNLQNWSAMSTNSEPFTNRSIILDATNQQSFYRAKVARPLFAFAIATVGRVNLSGNLMAADSFDSADPSYNTIGRYDPAKAKDGGDVGAFLGITNSLSIGNVNIFGHVSTGPDGGIVVGLIGAVGSTAWHNAGNTGIQPGWSANDMTVDFPDIKPPFTSGFTPGAGVVDGVAYNFVLGNANYAMLAGTLKGKVVVTGTNANLYVGRNANVKFTGADRLWIQSNATLNIYCDSTNGVDFSGQGVQNIGSASQFRYWGTTNNTSLNYGGNSQFTGLIYAPSSNFSLSGGGTAIDFSGAIVTKTMKLNGNYIFHFDEDLKRAGPFY